MGFERMKFIKDCECTKEDFQCDAHFYRNLNNDCVKRNGKISYEVPKTCVGKYTVS